MQIIEGNITDISEGVIVQQVNCMGAIGAGVSGAIIKKWPAVKKDYLAKCSEYPRQELLGMITVTAVSRSLFVVNLFSQYSYGNSAKTGLVYTDMDVLVHGLKTLVYLYGKTGQQIYVPYGIGCGLAGGNWQELVRRTEELPIIAVKLPNY